MDLSRFLGLPGTPDDRKVIGLMTSPAMHDQQGNPAGYLSLVDSGANLRQFSVVKAEGSPAAEPSRPWAARFLESVGLGHWAEAIARKGEDGGPLTFDAAIQAERLRRARWESTDALWEVIRNVMAADASTVMDKPGAVKLALEQFSAQVLGIVTATTALAVKAEDRDQVLKALDRAEPGEVGADLVSKAGRVISAANVAKLTSARETMATAMAALDDLIRAGSTADPATPQALAAKSADLEEPMLSAAALGSYATAASDHAIKAAKAAGLNDPARLAQIGADAATAVYKAAVMGPPQSAMPTDTLAGQMAQSGGMGAQARDPLTMITEALGAVSSLATKMETMAGKLDGLDRAINGHGDGATREPGLVELTTKSAELSTAVAVKVAKLEGTPAAPRGAGDPPAQVTRKGEADPSDATWTGSAFDFGNRPRA
jgi:hypothetical protein